MSHLTKPGVAYALHALVAALAAALLLVAILGWHDFTDPVADVLFSPDEGTKSTRGDTWVRVGLAVLAVLAAFAIRGIWADVALAVVAGLLVFAIAGSLDATSDTYVAPPAKEAEVMPVPAHHVRVALPGTVKAPAAEVPRDAPARLVAVVKVRDEDGEIRIESRRHEVIPRKTLVADKAPEARVPVDVARGTDDETAGDLIADLEAAQAVYLLPG